MRIGGYRHTHTCPQPKSTKGLMHAEEDQDTGLKSSLEVRPSRIAGCEACAHDTICPSS